MAISQIVHGHYKAAMCVDRTYSKSTADHVDCFAVEEKCTDSRWQSMQRERHRHYRLSCCGNAKQVNLCLCPPSYWNGIDKNELSPAANAKQVALIDATQAGWNRLKILTLCVDLFI